MKKIIFLFFFLFLFTAQFSFTNEGKWSGLDEVVIEKIAEEKGKKPKPLFELEGDLELFIFSFFFGISGFISGYYWRKILSEKKGVSSTL